MKYISLFSGIGGFENGIHQASEKMGIELECVFSSEIDKYARQIYEKNFGVEPYGDIKQINEYDIPDHEMLVGGFPCQAFSIAGKRAGFDDIRGTLFFEIARIARAKRPEILLLENVRGLLSHDKGRTFEVILKTLDNIGYDVEWQVLNSKNYGVPQNRERVFIIGHLRGSSGRKIFPITGKSRQINNQPVNSKYKLVAIDNGKLINRKIFNCLDANYYKGLGCNQQRTGIMLTERRTEEAKKIRKESMKTGKDFSPRRGKELVPRNDELSNCLTSGQTKEHLLLVKEATNQGYTEANVGDSVNYSNPNSKTRRGRVSNIANTLDTGCQQGVVTEDIRIRRLTPIECERLQGFPDGFTEFGIKDGEIINISDSQRYKCLGNAVSIPVIEAIITELFK